MARRQALKAEAPDLNHKDIIKVSSSLDLLKVWQMFRDFSIRRSNRRGLHPDFLLFLAYGDSQSLFI
jgi:hypothetical protein